MFTLSQRVVCVDASFPPDILKYYTQLPTKDATYTVRAVKVGVGLDGTEGEICIYVQELVNPRSSVPPYPERGFKAERFVPLEEMTDQIINAEPRIISIGIPKERELVEA